MNTYEKWFSGVVLIGVLFNLWFAIPSLFFPSYIVNVIGIDSDFDTIWLRDAGMLLIAGSAFHALTARARHRLPEFAWVVVASRFLGAAVGSKYGYLTAWAPRASQNCSWFFHRRFGLRNIQRDIVVSRIQRPLIRL